MHWCDVSDHARVRLRNVRQLCDLTQVRHAEFHNSNVVLPLQFQKHKRQPKMIIKVAFGFMHAKTRRKNVSDRFLGGRLTSGTSDGDQRPRPYTANPARQLL